MVLVQLKRPYDDLLAHVHEGNDQSALASSDSAEPRSQVLILVLALLVQEDVMKRLLDVLEVEGDAVRLGQHSVDQVLLEADVVLLVLGLELVLELVSLFQVGV